MSSGVALVHLPDGTPVWARISDIEQLSSAGEHLAEHPVDAPPSRAPAQRRSSYADTGFADTGFADTGFADQLAARVESLKGLITGVAASVAAGARAVSPDEVSVSFGIELTARSGRIIGLLADGEAKGAITVTLTWQGAPPEDVGQAG
jgi:hypothetical protein